MQFVTRSAWEAMPPENTGNLWGNHGFAVHYTADRSPESHTNCANVVWAIQNFHMRKGWADIAYNWLVCPHGFIFEGRGWDVRSAAQGTAYGNRYYHAVCWLGGPNDTPTDEAKVAIAIVIKEGQDRKLGSKIYPHNWFKSTACPGPLSPWVREGETKELVGLIDAIKKIHEVTEDQVRAAWDAGWILPKTQWSLQYFVDAAQSGAINDPNWPNYADIRKAINGGVITASTSESEGADLTARKAAAVADAKADKAHDRLNAAKEAL